MEEDVGHKLLNRRRDVTILEVATFIMSDNRIKHVFDKYDKYSEFTDRVIDAGHALVNTCDDSSAYDKIARCLGQSKETMLHNDLDGIMCDRGYEHVSFMSEYYCKDPEMPKQFDLGGVSISLVRWMVFQAQICMRGYFFDGALPYGIQRGDRFVSKREERIWVTALFLWINLDYQYNSHANYTVLGLSERNKDEKRDLVRFLNDFGQYIHVDGGGDLFKMSFSHQDWGKIFIVTKGVHAEVVNGKFCDVLK